MTELFDLSELIQPLTQEDKENLVAEIVKSAKLGRQFMYGVRETAGMLHITYDEIQTLLCTYRLDAINVLTAIRIPWWSLCEYLLDPAEDIDKMVDKYIKTIPQKQQKRGGKK